MRSLFLAMLAIVSGPALGQPATPPVPIHTTKITDSGGRLDWYKGPAHDLVAFDAITDMRTRNTELFTMKPDGSGRFCVTCNAPVPKGFVGQPVWHPDGDHIVFQVENERSPHTLFNHVAWGINNDLWIIRKDGSKAQRLYQTKLNHGALHPQISPDGRTLVFAARTPTGRLLPSEKLRKLAPGGENPWEGWKIFSTRLEIDEDGNASVSKLKLLADNPRGFLETHQVLANGDVIFSKTRNGVPYVDDIYRMDRNGGHVRQLIDSPETWDEHGLYSPDRRFLAFVSSRHDKSWRASRSRAKDLETEIYVMRIADGAVRQVSAFNAGRTRTIASDFSWNKDGTALLVQAAPFRTRLIGGDETLPPEIWLIRFGPAP